MRPVAALCMLGLLAIGGCKPDAVAPGRASAAVLGTVPDWSAELPELLPAMQACLKSTGATAVTKAWPIASGLAGVRLLQTDGQRIDCVATEDGRAVLMTEPVRAASQLEGEREPLYTPVQKPQGTACLETSPAEGGAGGGWLSYDTCRQPRAPKPSAEIDPPPPATRGHGAS